MKQLNRDVQITENGKPQLGLRVSHNLMEGMVLEELDRQFNSLSPKAQEFVNRAEVVAYALNRLPALYATTQEGLRRQQAHGHKELKAKIKETVRRGLSAVQIDPFRCSDPIELEDQQEMHQQILLALRDVLSEQKLTWENVPQVVRQKLVETARGEITWRQDALFNWEEVPLHQHSAS